MKNGSLLPEVILGICIMLALILMTIMVLTQDCESQQIDKDTNTEPKAKNAFLDRYCVTRSEYFRQQSAYCKNR